MAKNPKPPKSSASKAGYAAKNLIPKLARINSDPMDYLGKPSPKKAMGPAKPKRPAIAQKRTIDKDLVKKLKPMPKRIKKTGK